LLVVIREIIGLARLSTVESLRQRALSIIESDRDGGRADAAPAHPGARARAV
jgi:uncharacterized membrane protein YcjF (UPF0283 family)